MGGRLRRVAEGEDGLMGWVQPSLEEASRRYTVTASFVSLDLARYGYRGACAGWGLCWGEPYVSTLYLLKNTIPREYSLKLSWRDFGGVIKSSQNQYTTLCHSPLPLSNTPVAEAS